jgi:hypothetical protein
LAGKFQGRPDVWLLADVDDFGLTFGRPANLLPFPPASPGKPRSFISAAFAKAATFLAGLSREPPLQRQEHCWNNAIVRARRARATSGAYKRGDHGGTNSCRCKPLSIMVRTEFVQRVFSNKQSHAQVSCGDGSCRGRVGW